MPASTQRQRNIAMLRMLLCAALWSIAGIFIKLIPWNSFVLAGLRSLIAGGVIAVYMRFAHLRLVVSRRTLLSGFLMAWLYFCFVGANKLTTAANAIALQYTAPLFIMLLSVALFHEKLRRLDVIAAVITFLGIVLFFFDQLGPGRLLGNVIALISGVLFAVMYLSLGVMQSADERMSYVLLGQIFTFVLSIPFLFLYPPALAAKPVICLLILGVLQLGTPLVLCALAAEHCPPIAQSLLSALEPLLNPVWVLLFTGERPGPMALLGGLVVIITVTVWAVLGHRGRAAKEA
jgi:drug/metabolite transporter (DMT)-like permease